MLFFAFVACTAAAQLVPSPTPDVSLEEVAELVERSALPEGARFATEFSIRTLESEQTDGKYERVGDLALVDEELYRVTLDAGRFRIDRSHTTRSPERWLYVQTNIWSANRWAHWTNGANFVMLEDSPGPVSPLGYDLEFNGLGERFLRVDRRLSTSIRNGREISVAMEGNYVRCRWAPAGTAHPGTWSEVRVRIGAQPLVTEYARQLGSPSIGGGSEDFLVRQRWSVSEWVSIGGWLIPATASLDVTSHSNRGNGLHLMHSELRRMSVSCGSSAEVSEGDFQVPLSTETSVLDSRLNLTYQVGKSVVLIDGFRCELPSPVSSLLTGSALIQQLSQTASNVHTRSSAEGTSQGLAAYLPRVAAAVAGVTLITWTARRWREWRSNRLKRLACFSVAAACIVIFVSWTFMASPAAREEKIDVSASFESALGANGSFDFGRINIDSGPQVAQRTILLRNGTKETWTVEKVLSSCGCTTAEPSSNRVAVGGVLALSVGVRVSNCSEIVAQVQVLLKSDDSPLKSHVEILDISALGYRSQHLLVSDPVTGCNSAGEAEVAAFVTRAIDAGVPPPLQITPSDGIEFAASEWQQLDPGDLITSRPSRWGATLSVVAQASSLPRVIRVSLPGGPAAEIELRSGMPAGHTSESMETTR